MRVIAVAFIGLLATTTAQAADGQPCAPRDAVQAEFAKSKHQHLSVIGLSAGGNLLEILTARDGSWSLFQTAPDGTSCLITVGSAWQRTEPSENDSFVLTAPGARGNTVRVPYERDPIDGPAS